MIVTRSSFDAVLTELEQPGTYTLDTETTGLAPYKGDRLFSIVISQGERVWYFNFNQYEGISDAEWLGREHKLALQERIFHSSRHRWNLHNAKYDMHILGVDGLELYGEIFCTYAAGRLLHNDLRAYNLDALSKRWLGAEKSDAVKDYCESYGLFTKSMKGKQERKNYQFWRAPLPIVADYAGQDASLTERLAAFELTGIAEIDATCPDWRPPLAGVVRNEMALTKVLFEMEKVGVQLDKVYCEKALEAERRTYMDASAKFAELTGVPYDDSPTCIAKAFKQLGITTPTGKNNRVLTNKEVLKGIKHPVADVIQTWRKSYKRAVTYYANFLAMADESHVIHADFHQGGTKTGRLSCRDPNLQNLSRPDKDALPDDESADAFEVRRAFVPRDGFVFFCPDYDQIEYRLMLEYAEESLLIALVNGGLDVHQATADLLGVTRFEAKTINFMLIYGGGIGKLAAALGISWAEAKQRYQAYFRQLPKICALIEQVRAVAGQRGVLYNWFGRRYTFAGPDMVYTTAPNWLIQGGCADILKIALIRCHNFLRDEKARSRIVLNIHDEIVFELHRSELWIAPKLVEIMEAVYPGKHLKLTAGPAWSPRSLADKLDGYPVAV